MRRSLIALPVLALASLALVACGDDDKSSGSGGARAATAVEGDAFCLQAAKVDNAMSGMDSFGEDPARLEGALKSLVAEATKAEALAPTDIVDALKKSVQGFRDLAAALEKFNWDFNAAIADPEVVTLLDSPELAEASDAVESYLSDKCGIAP